MAWMPGAQKRQINWLNNLSRHGTKPTAVVFHISAGESSSLYSYFSRIRFAGSHFHVADNGHKEQYAGTGARSAADRTSRRTISVETQGSWGPWSKAQVQSNAEILAFAHKTHGIPLRLMTSSKTSQKGAGWHRLGVDGNFPSGLLGGRLQRGGGELWSGSRGKACPTPPCIEQMDDVVRLAKAIALREAGSSRDDDRPAVKKVWRPLGTLRQGSTGTGVKVLQKRVHATADGKFGPKTAAKVEYYQRKYNLTADGVVGPKTWVTLLRDDDAYLKRGDKNAAVTILQLLLLTGRTGTFGPVTESRVKKMQADLGVGADGVVGPATRTRLLKNWK